jgi:DNA-binding SARP family transcriptional activator
VRRDPVSTVAPQETRTASTGSPGHVVLSLLNAFELRCDDLPVTLPPSAQRLVAFVALHDHPLQRVYVAGTLWIDASDARAGASLRSSLWRLNRAGHVVVEASSTHLRLAADVDVDVRHALGVAHRLLDGSADAADLESGEAVLRGELLPDWYDEWLVFERERVRQVSLHALEALAERFVSVGELARALEAALSAVRSEPLRESAHRALIRVHLAEGNRAEALRQYDLCRSLLRDRLGVEPSPQLDELLVQ